MSPNVSCVSGVIGQRMQVRDQHGLLVVPLKRYPGSQRSGIMTGMLASGWTVTHKDNLFSWLASEMFACFAGLVSCGR